MHFYFHCLQFCLQNLRLRRAVKHLRNKINSQTNQFQKQQLRSKERVQSLKLTLINKNAQLKNMKKTITALIANTQSQSSIYQTTSLPAFPTNLWWTSTPVQTQTVNSSSNTKETQTYSSFAAITERLNEVHKAVEKIREQIEPYIKS